MLVPKKRLEILRKPQTMSHFRKFKNIWHNDSIVDSFMSHKLGNLEIKMSVYNSNEGLRLAYLKKLPREAELAWQVSW